MIIRQSTDNDIKDIMKIYDIARKFMIDNGNATQWGAGYPSQNILINDIKNNYSYVCVNDDIIVGSFSFIIGEEPTYHKIENGEWNYNKTYGTIHRLASSGKVKGVAKSCFEFCTQKIDYVRIDTHADNKAMQTAINNYGFKKCGIIHVTNGSERIAFDYRNWDGC